MWNLAGVYSGGRFLAIVCCIFGSGVYTDFLYYSDKHRWLKRRRYRGLYKNAMA